MTIKKSAKTIDEAIRSALDELNVDISQVDVNVIEKPKSGFLGFGAKDALVEVTLKEVNEIEKKDCCIDNNYKSDDESIEKIKNFLKDLILNMGTDCKVSHLEDEQALNLFIEESDDFKMLIGKSGETLDSIQYILNIFARKNTSFDKKIYLDVNGYKKRKEQSIAELSMSFAKKAIKYKKVMRLKPMNAYERRIVHATLHNMNGVFTVSEGDEPYRKVVIKPKF